MQLYSFICQLRQKGIYQTLFAVGAIPFRINQDVCIYEEYLREQKNEKRKTQLTHNVSVNMNVSVPTVYRAITSMEQDINSAGEILLK